MNSKKRSIPNIKNICIENTLLTNTMEKIIIINLSVSPQKKLLITCCFCRAPEKIKAFKQNTMLAKINIIPPIKEDIPSYLPANTIITAEINIVNVISTKIIFFANRIPSFIIGENTSSSL